MRALESDRSWERYFAYFVNMSVLGRDSLHMVWFGFGCAQADAAACYTFIPTLFTEPA